MLALLMVENKIYDGRVPYGGMIFIPDFMQIHQYSVKFSGATHITQNMNMLE